MGALRGRTLTDLLRIERLTVRHGGVAVLSDLDLTVRKGELFVLLGESGAGKTTLLRAVAGFIRADGGRILLDGVDLGPLPPHRRPVNTMFQSYALFPHMTVAANIAFGPRRQGMPKARAMARAREMLGLVRLDGFDDRMPHQLSGGQQQRVALARSLAPNPALLLLDEPLSALDRGLRAETRDELVRLNRQLGTGFVVVTHDQHEALTMADRVGVLRGGRMAQVGTPAELYETPMDRFVARFMGVENILPCVVRADGVTADLPASGVAVRAARPIRPGAGWLAVRAERLRPDRRSDANRVVGIAAERVYAGDRMRVGLRLTDGTVVRANLPWDSAVDWAVGAEASLSWPAEASVLLAD